MFKRKIDRKIMYLNSNGYTSYYKRIKGQSNLVHRQVAHDKIWLKNRDKYPLPFSKYVVDHKDMDKLNYTVSNLRIETSRKHQLSHTDTVETKHQLLFTNIPVNKNKVTFYMFLFFFGWVLLEILKGSN